MSETTNDVAEEEREDRQSISRRQAESAARHLLWTGTSGVLSTASAKHDGWPFGSVVPYALDAQAQPLIYIAGIAQHYKNIAADERVSLLVHEPVGPGEDIQVRARITVLARARRTRDLDDARARYAFRVPGSRDYAKTHDFGLFTLHIEQARYIGGFGRIFWLESDAMLAPPAADPLREVAQGAVDHMNADHADALAVMAEVFHGKTASAGDVTATSIDERGMWMELAGDRLRVEFAEPATAETLRSSVVELVKRARKAG